MLHHKDICGPYVLTLVNRMATVRVVYGKASRSSRPDTKKTCVMNGLDMCLNHIQHFAFNNEHMSQLGGFYTHFNWISFSL